ncbi:MAG: endolytic transglycosylase MltG [Lachnospiraceae bacterium]|jgi:hypothetical protein|nr:endolytic transglycosylase MltG [Lachnospiraceae bacterium]
MSNRLKMYLRGLGTGILVTALLLIFLTGQDERLTDDQIKERAKELGMIEVSTLSDLNNLQEKTEPSEETQISTEEPQTESSEQSQEGNETQGSDTSNDLNEPPTSSVSDESNGLPTSSVSDESNEPQISNADEEMISITIQRGDSSLSVSRTLQTAGLIEDAKEYDAYLCREGYDHYLRTGVHQIPVGATYEQIALLITSGR